MKPKVRKILPFAISGVALLAIAGGITGGLMANASNLDLVFKGQKVVDSDGEGLAADYIAFKFDSQEKALKNAQEMTQKTAEEGMVLLKNTDNVLPLASGAKVTTLGAKTWHNNMSGGEDPANTEGAVSIGVGIQNCTKLNSNAATDAFASDSNDSETLLNKYKGVESTFAEYDTAIITVARNSGEGNDQVKEKGADEGKRTGLTLSADEIKLIDYANQTFSKVIIIVNSANTMELGFLDDNDPNMSGEGVNKVWHDQYSGLDMHVGKIKGAIWAGCCGSQGGTALANILVGDVNPSGNLPDIYVRDLKKDPTYKNFGNYQYKNSAQLATYADAKSYFVEYEEDIYIGYRYYETAAKEAANGNYAGFDYHANVVYPFGYGLSYTTFEQEFVGNPVYDEAKGTYTFQVKVKNTGSKAGKSIAKIFVNVPYVSGGVEKAHVVLGGFTKTDVLEPNAETTVEIVVNRDYFTSYDYTDEKCYILDAGDYNFYLAQTSHDWVEIDAQGESEKAKHLKTVNQAKKLVFKEGKDGKRITDKSVAVNKEDDELNYKFKKWTAGHAQGDGRIYDFTRQNFKDSFPTAPAGDDYNLTDDLAVKQIGIYDVSAKENNPIKDMPKVDTDETSYTLSGMRGVDWDDPKWDDYMNQFSVKSMANMFMNGGWNEKADEENGVPESYDADSPYGYYAHALSIGKVNKWYCGDPMVAATFNTKLARELGEAFGEEAHANTYYNDGKGTLITGLYGYGLNVHRSAFGGRNYEYYSEDPILAGKMAAAESSGASEKGLITFMKHFVLNDQETNRQNNGYCAWVNEQAFREVYTRGWEIYMKEASMEINYYDDMNVMQKKTMPAATGVMTSYNRIGANWAGASVSLDGILRDEFGYHGTTLTDAGGNRDTYMTTDYMLRRGGHLTLANNGSDGLYDTTSPTAVYHLKDAAKHILYNKANSNCVVGLAPGAKFHYTTSPWRLALGWTWAGIGALCVIDAAYIALVLTGVIKTKEKAPKADSVVANEEEF